MMTFSDIFRLFSPASDSYPIVSCEITNSNPTGGQSAVPEALINLGSYNKYIYLQFKGLLFFFSRLECSWYLFIISIGLLQSSKHQGLSFPFASWVLKAVSSPLGNSLKLLQLKAVLERKLNFIITYLTCINLTYAILLELCSQSPYRVALPTFNSPFTPLLPLERSKCCHAIREK